MDIYRPHTLPKGKLLPVMVWLHGGALTQGAASHFPGTGMVKEASNIVSDILFSAFVTWFLTATAEPPRYPNLD
jgi:carboxylesterase type B